MASAPGQGLEDAPRVVVKVIVLGSSNVGKTSLMRRFTQGQFTEKRVATTGADYLSKRLFLHGQHVVLQIWDTAGQERFHSGSLGNAFYRGSDAAILVYDVTNPKTFQQVEKWRDELLERIDSPDTFPTVVVGNKTDMPHAEGVDRAAVLSWCRQRGIGHIETSAKDGTGVADAMEAIAMLAVDNKRRRPPPETERKGQVRLRAPESSNDLGAMYPRQRTNSERCCGSGAMAGAVD